VEASAPAIMPIESIVILIKEERVENFKNLFMMIILLWLCAPYYSQRKRRLPKAAFFPKGAHEHFGAAIRSPVLDKFFTNRMRHGRRIRAYTDVFTACL
jgi:hypothetical protein